METRLKAGDEREKLCSVPWEAGAANPGGGARGQRQAACGECGGDCKLRWCDAVRLKAAAGGEKPTEGRRGSSSPAEGHVHPISTGRVHAAGLGTNGLLWVWGRVLTSRVASTWGSSAWQTSI